MVIFSRLHVPHFIYLAVLGLSYLEEETVTHSSIIYLAVPGLSYLEEETVTHSSILV